MRYGVEGHHDAVAGRSHPNVHGKLLLNVDNDNENLLQKKTLAMLVNLVDGRKAGRARDYES